VSEVAVRRRPVASLWWGLLAAVVTASLGTDLVLLLVDGDPAEPLGTRLVRWVSFFTIESNVLVAVATATLARDPERDGVRWRVLRLDALLGIAITGLVYVVVLAPTDHPQGLHVWTNAGLHYVSPVATLLGWLLLGPRPRVTGATVAQALVWPVVYVGWTLLHGAVTGWYPYPFLDVAELGYARALVDVAGVVLLALALLGLFRLVDGTLPATGRRKAVAGTAPPAQHRRA
jgi:hypothetical protein